MPDYVNDSNYIGINMDCKLTKEIYLTWSYSENWAVIILYVSLKNSVFLDLNPFRKK